MPVQNVNLSLGNPYSAQLGDIERRRKLLAALEAQSMQPLEAPPTPPGGFTVPISPMQGFAKIAQALAASYGHKKADEESKEVGQRYIADLLKTVERGADLGAGRPAQPEIPQAADEIGGGPGRPAMPG